MLQLSFEDVTQHSQTRKRCKQEFLEQHELTKVLLSVSIFRRMGY